MQQLRDGRNSIQYVVLEFSGMELPLHVAADVFPARIADAGVDAAIGEEFHLVVGQQQEVRFVLGFRLKDFAKRGAN